MCYKWKYAREEILAENYIASIFHSDQLFEQESSIASITS